MARSTYMASQHIFAFSIRNNLPIKKLNKCLKPNVDLDATHMSILEGDSSHDVQHIVELCIQLQEQVTGLENIVKEQNKRLSALESDKTKVSLNNIGAPLTGSMDQAEGGKLGQPKRADPGTQVNPPQPGDDPQHIQVNKQCQGWNP